MKFRVPSSEFRVKNYALKVLIVVFLLVTGNCQLVAVCNAQPSLPSELINIHTAYTPLRGDLATDFRIYDGGGVMAKIKLGIIDWLTFGLSLSVDGLIGSNTCVIVPGNPGVIAKIRVLDEMTTKNWPTISLGYDNSKYAGIMGKGFYAVVSKEFPMGKMFQHGHGGIAYIGQVAPTFFLGYDIFFTQQLCAAVEIESVYNYNLSDGSPRGSQKLRSSIGFLYIPVPNLRIGLFVCAPVDELLTREIHISYTAKLF